MQTGPLWQTLYEWQCKGLEVSRDLIPLLLSFLRGWSTGPLRPPRLRPREPDETQNRTSALCSLYSQGTRSNRLFQESDTVSNLWSGQVMLLFPCLICKATMCVPEHRDSARKCSEAGSLKDFFQLKSDARGLHAALPHFVPVRFEDFLPCRPTWTVSVPGQPTRPSYTIPLGCCFL